MQSAISDCPSHALEMGTHRSDVGKECYALRILCFGLPIEPPDLLHLERFRPASEDCETPSEDYGTPSEDFETLSEAFGTLQKTLKPVRKTEVPLSETMNRI